MTAQAVKSIRPGDRLPPALLPGDLGLGRQNAIVLGGGLAEAVGGAGFCGIQAGFYSAYSAWRAAIRPLFSPEKQLGRSTSSRS